jgi:hypothetical protein
MNMRSFAGGFALAAIPLIAGGVWFLQKLEQQPVLYPPASYYDDGDSRPESGYVVVDGVLIGEDMNGRTYLKVTCDNSSGKCSTLELSQPSTLKMVMPWQDEWKIVAWMPETIKAASEPAPGACNRVEFTIYRKTEEATYTRIPNPQASGERCKAFSKRTFTWKLGRQPTDDGTG